METLEKEGWKNTNKGDPVPKFFFRDKQITAAPHETHGRGWQANIHGHQSVSYSKLRIQYGHSCYVTVLGDFLFLMYVG